MKNNSLSVAALSLLILITAVTLIFQLRAFTKGIEQFDQEGGFHSELGEEF